MGCLNVQSRREYPSVQLHSLLMDASVMHSRRDGQSVELGSYQENILLLGGRRERPSIQIRSGIICNTETAAYLRVEPEVIWLLPDSAEVAVFSNVNWYIE